MTQSIKRTAVEYTTIVRAAPSRLGKHILHVVEYVNGVEQSKNKIGNTTRPQNGWFTAFGLDGEQVGQYKTRKQAGHELKRAYDAADTGPVLMSIADAALVLSPDAKNPVNALKKKISRGSVQTQVVDGETMVVMPTA